MKNKLHTLVLMLGCICVATVGTQAQVKIGNNPNTINPNSILELETTNKGILLPRIALNSTTQATPMTAHVAGITVYNIATVNDVSPGYYYNDGGKWVRLITAADAKWIDGTNTAGTNLMYAGDAKTTGNDVVVTHEGNIGIGTASPAYKLDVNGIIRAKEVKIETGWADFVFDNEYALPPLSEVERHIRQHKHLPGIPPEKEIATNGANLGEMQVKLLQKIEELTLYLIEQEKENRRKEVRIEQLLKRIEALEKSHKNNH